MSDTQLSCFFFLCLCLYEYTFISIDSFDYVLRFFFWAHTLNDSEYLICDFYKNLAVVVERNWNYNIWVFIYKNKWLTTTHTIRKKLWWSTQNIGDSLRFTGWLVFFFLFLSAHDSFKKKFFYWYIQLH